MSEQDTGAPPIERFKQIASELEADAEYVGVTLTLPYAQTIQRAAAKASEAITSLLADRERQKAVTEAMDTLVRKLRERADKAEADRERLTRENAELETDNAVLRSQFNLCHSIHAEDQQKTQAAEHRAEALVSAIRESVAAMDKLTALYRRHPDGDGWLAMQEFSGVEVTADKLRALLTEQD